jgi:hypothetical protein
MVEDSLIAIDLHILANTLHARVSAVLELSHGEKNKRLLSRCITSSV